MENISRMIVAKIIVSTAGRRGTVSTNAVDTKIVVHSRPDSLGSRPVHSTKYNHYYYYYCYMVST